LQGTKVKIFLNLSYKKYPLPLLTKTQLKDYEPGEFSDCKQRTFSETRDLIEHFPWTQQRDHIAISLTNPSITIEGLAGDYLKLAPYYNGKFVLYYLDGKNHLFTYSMPTLQEAYPIIQSFFDNKLDIAGFKHQPTPFINNRHHFVAANFTYTMSSTSTLLSVCLLSLLWLAFPIISIFAFIAHPPSVPLTCFGVIGLIFASLALILIASSISHYRASKGKVLSISRGNPLFQFGSIGAPATYDKKDISDIIQYGASRGFEGLKRTEIIFKDGASINISGMIADIGTMSLKFPEQKITRKAMAFPFIPPSASIPS